MIQPCYYKHPYFSLDYIGLGIICQLSVEYVCHKSNHMSATCIDHPYNYHMLALPLASNVHCYVLVTYLHHHIIRTTCDMCVSHEGHPLEVWEQGSYAGQGNKVVSLRAMMV